MKKLSIYLLIITVIAAAGVGTGCTKQLNQQPYGVVAQSDYYKTQDDAIAGVNAAYHRLQDYTFGGVFTGFDCWPDLLSPDVESHQDFTSLRQVHEYNATPDN